GDDSGGGLDRGTEDSVGSMVWIAERGEREGNEGFLEITAALERHQQIGLARGHAGLERDLEARLEDLVPDFPPGDCYGDSQGVWMARRAGQRDEGIVVEIDELFAQRERGGEARVENDVDRVAPALRPALDGAQRRAGPIEFPESSRHLALHGGGLRRSRQGRPHIAIRGQDLA